MVLTRRIGGRARPFGHIGLAAALLGAAAACAPNIAPKFSPGDGGNEEPDAGQWVNATANLAGLTSECGNLSFLSAKPDEDLLLAGVALRGVWGSANGGDTWTQLGQGAGSSTIINRASSFIYDTEHPHTFWESGKYNGGGVYRTLDDGVTFTQLGNATHDDLVSIDFTDPRRQTLLAGSHEQAARLLRSIDGGDTWTDIGPRLPAGAGNSTSPMVINSQVHLLGTWQGTASGIYRTTDGGDTWSQVFEQGVLSAPLLASDGSVYWLLQNGAGVTRSTDHGATWSAPVGAGIALGVSILDLPDGRLAASTATFVVVSADHGVSWTRVGSKLPFGPAGLAYSRFRKAFYIWHFSCLGSSAEPVLDDAIMSLRFDVQTG